MKPTAEERFYSHVNKDGPIPEHVPHLGECHVWTASKTDQGYGKFKLNGKTVLAHRLALKWKLGRDLLPGMEACHHCDNESCVRGDHLFEGTPKENQQDASRKGRKAAGARHFSQTMPWRLARGDSNGSRKHPERLRHWTGETNAMSRLTEDAVRQIRDRCAAGESQSVIATWFGVSSKTISKIVRRERWKHVA